MILTNEQARGTCFKEAYLDLKVALHGIDPSGDTAISDKVNAACERAWDMYLVCEALCNQNERSRELLDELSGGNAKLEPTDELPPSAKSADTVLS